MKIPSVHLNGTNRISLVRQHCEAADAIYSAISKLNATAPDGRDFYLQGAEALMAAQHEHNVRLRKLVEVHADLLAIAKAVAGRGAPL